MPWFFADFTGEFDSAYVPQSAELTSNRYVSNGTWDIARGNPSPGRRLRTFSRLVTTQHTRKHSDAQMNIDDAYRLLQEDPVFSELPLRTIRVTPLYDAIPEVYATKVIKDAVLHLALQDLGWMIGWELSQACNAFDDPDMWYPGIDDGIEPVPDDHVDLVIWASSRELEREVRGRPPAPIAELPQRIKRAFVERRRWHYQCYGIGRKEYEANCWSLWNVNEDTGWVPPWIEGSTT